MSMASYFTLLCETVLLHFPTLIGTSQKYVSRVPNFRFNFAWGPCGLENIRNFTRGWEGWINV